VLRADGTITDVDDPMSPAELEADLFGFYHGDAAGTSFDCKMQFDVTGRMLPRP
jgi:hypothetical protein